MDRIMGERLVLADKGGLSEGMADFISFLVINSVTQSENYEDGSCVDFVYFQGL